MRVNILEIIWESVVYKVYGSRKLMKYKALLWNPTCLWQLGRSPNVKSSPSCDWPWATQTQAFWDKCHTITSTDPVMSTQWIHRKVNSPRKPLPPQPSQDISCVYSCAKRWQDDSPCFWATHDPVCCVSKDKGVEGVNLEIKGKIPETRDPSAESEGHMRAWQANMEGVVKPRRWGDPKQHGWGAQKHDHPWKKKCKVGTVRKWW